MPTYKLTIEYEGTRYSGWAAQANTPKTIQGRLQAAAREVLGECELGGAGRTDAGVHAAAQVAHLRTSTLRSATSGAKQGATIDPLALARAINDLLPHDIHVLRAERAKERFDARREAVSRVYLYQIARRRTAFAKPFVWWVKDELDAGAMGRAARDAVGRHDFGAFADRRLDEGESRLVEVEAAEVGVAGDLILVRLRASHFLWKMVRKIVSLLVEIGRGNEEEDALSRRLIPNAAPYEPTAPPSGLFLEAVVYPGERFDKPLAPIVAVT